jgi:IS30 family transposase
MLIELGRYVDESVAQGIQGAQASGYSYGEIAARLGTTRQAVHQRLRRQRGIDDSAPIGAATVSAV